MQCAPVSLFYYGTEVTVKLSSPNSSAKIIIDDAEFIVNSRKPEQEIMPSFCLNNDAFIDEPPEIPRKLYLADDCKQEVFMEYGELIDFEYIDNVQITTYELNEVKMATEGIINTANISPPPYDGEINGENNELPDYSVPYIDPPSYEPNADIKFEQITLQNFTTKYYLPNCLHIYIIFWTRGNG